MGDKHVVRFEPVGIEIEVDEEQTVLRAAFDQGLMLMHGCKEGQCSACKSFLLEGDDVELDKYSTFALPDFEKEEGFTLLCRAHVYEDVTIELLNYDEEMIRSGLPIQEVETEVVANDPVTHDLRHLVLRMVSPDTDLVFVGGGAGMAPILCLLRTMAERGIDRKAVYYYGARRRADLCFEEELRALEQILPNFRFVPALSDEDWEGENGLITDVVSRSEPALARAHGYICGPPPMVEAAVPLLTRLGIPEKHVYFDKFTTTGDPDKTPPAP